jgi:hypothetical protein
LTRQSWLEISGLRRAQAISVACFKFSDFRIMADHWVKESGAVGKTWVGLRPVSDFQ